MEQDYCWKVVNDEGFIPPVAYYKSDRVAARAIQDDSRVVTIIFMEEE